MILLSRRRVLEFPPSATDAPMPDVLRHNEPANAGDNDCLVSLWSVLMQLRQRRREGKLRDDTEGFSLSADGDLHQTALADPTAVVSWSGATLAAAAGQPPAAHDFASLYAPLFYADRDRSLVIAHLGQSIDANIATETGDSCFVTGQANIIHLHRMRALSDAILVGAGTAQADDPRLTTRLVEGPNPVRVLIDPERRVSRHLRIYNDSAAPTLLVCAADRLVAGDSEDTVIGLPRDEDAGLALPALVAALRERGLFALFIEGGGVTVSRWATAGLLDRLQITIAPVFIGAGRPALQLPPSPTMANCLRPPSRVFRLGEDLLWDFDLRADAAPATPVDEAALAPQRVR